MTDTESINWTDEINYRLAEAAARYWISIYKSSRPEDKELIKRISAEWKSYPIGCKARRYTQEILSYIRAMDTKAYKALTN